MQQLDFSAIKEKNEHPFGRGAIKPTILIVVTLGATFLLGPISDLAYVISYSIFLFTAIGVVMRFLIRKAEILRNSQQKFSQDNGFRFYQTATLDERLYFMGNNIEYSWDNVVEGVYKNRPFMFGIVTVSRKLSFLLHSPGIGYIGLLVLREDLVTSRMVDLAEDGLAKLGGFTTVEYFGGYAYIMVDNGLRLSSEGVQKLFDYIEAHSRPDDSLPT